MVEITSWLPGPSPVAGKSHTAPFDGGRSSSDGGVIVLREIAQRLILARTMTAQLRDRRDPDRILHSDADMALARMLMIERLSGQHRETFGLSGQYTYSSKTSSLEIQGQYTYFPTGFTAFGPPGGEKTR